MNANNDDDWTLRLLVFSPGGIITISLLSFFIWVVWAFSDREILIVTLTINDKTVARIYEDNFCDESRFPRFDIRIDGKAATKKYTIETDFVCSYSIQPEAFRVVCVEDESIYGVFYDNGKEESLFFAYDQKRQTPFPGPTSDSVPEKYEEILEREAAVTYKIRKSKR